MNLARGRKFSDRDMKRYILAVSPPRRGWRLRKALRIALVALVFAIGWCLVRSSCHPPQELRKQVRTHIPDPDGDLSWPVLSELLAGRMDLIPGSACVELATDGDRRYTLNTTLDQAFQTWVEGRLQVSMADGGVVVALDPSEGRILALAVYNRDPANPLAFFWKAYPAASVFKIVTASAAMDMGFLTPDSILAYTGRPHTLYRQHLRPDTPPWSSRVSLESAFARSINPVFGKIGLHNLGRPTLEEYGSTFYFNQPLPSEVPFETGVLRMSDDSLEIAEAASGFNRRTLLSPVQAAWMASVIVENGAAPAPWIVESIHDESESGPPLYIPHPPPIRVLSPTVANEMQRLMEATIRYGTCRRSFRQAQRIGYLRPLTFGGKTGNINNRADTIKYDWFVGYATGRGPGVSAIAVCVLMLHGKRLGHRANVIAFDVMNRYYLRKAKR